MRFLVRGENTKALQGRTNLGVGVLEGRCESLHLGIPFPALGLISHQQAVEDLEIGSRWHDGGEIMIRSSAGRPVGRVGRSVGRRWRKPGDCYRHTRESGEQSTLARSP